MTETEGDPSQEEVFVFLRRPESWRRLGVTTGPVEVIETHGALVFLAGQEVLKVKRAVKLAYLDFSTLDRRKAVLDRELALNSRSAPEIYRDVLAITREAGGHLEIDGKGAPVEWAVRMARFGQDKLLDAIARKDGISAGLAKALAEMAVASHEQAPVADGVDTPARLASVAATIAASLSAVGEMERAQEFAAHVGPQILEHRHLLMRRAAAGLVRRCHGDLHLGNVVLWHGKPVPFDAIEFDEDLATVDTLYDLAFLLMDLERHGCRPAANLALGRYLWRTGRDLDLEGLALLPLFLALRAGVRAMVRADRARQVDGDLRRDALARVLETLALARSYLQPPRPRLIAVGGLSGTGKSTLAARIAPGVGAAPGALHLRSDLERKALAGVGETEPLAPDTYTVVASARVYDRLMHRAELALRAGHSVVVDAVFARQDERERVSAIAAACGAPFSGVWLVADAAKMKERVAARRGDASDATVEVVERQLQGETGPIDWIVIDASHGPEQTQDAVLRRL